LFTLPSLRYSHEGIGDGGTFSVFRRCHIQFCSVTVIKFAPDKNLKNKTKLLIPSLKLTYIVKILKFQLPELTYDGPHLLQTLLLHNFIPAYALLNPTSFTAVRNVR